MKPFVDETTPHYTEPVGTVIQKTLIISEWQMSELHSQA
jgi:hypothetical protein